MAAIGPGSPGAHTKRTTWAHFFTTLAPCSCRSAREEQTSPQERTRGATQLKFQAGHVEGEHVRSHDQLGIVEAVRHQSARALRKKAREAEPLLGPREQLTLESE